MKNLTKIFLATSPVDKRLSFGINKNVILRAIHNVERRSKDGLPLDILATLVFSQLNPETGATIAESEILMFPPGGRESAYKQFVLANSQMLEIAKNVIKDPKDVEKVTSAMNAAIGEHKVVHKIMENRSKAITDTVYKELKSAMSAMFAKFIEILEPYTGSNSDTFGLLMVTNYKGEFLGLPKEARGFIKKNADSMKIPEKYKKWKNKKGKKEKVVADNIGDEAVVSVSNMQIMDSGDLSDI